MIHFIESRTLLVHTWPEILISAGALMEHFLEGSPPIRLWYVNKDEKSCVFVWLLIWVNVPMS